MIRMGAPSSRWLDYGRQDVGAPRS
jgi:hypothetical protein